MTIFVFNIVIFLMIIYNVVLIILIPLIKKSVSM